MEKFETSIHRIARQFDGHPPEDTWAQIERTLRQPAGGPRRRWWWLLLIGTLLLAAIAWFRFDGEPEPWRDHYWEAEAIALEKDKPMLVVFTQRSLAGDLLDLALQRKQITQLLAAFVPVRLAVDDTTALDPNRAEQLFPASRKRIEWDAKTEATRLSLLRDSTIIELHTLGQVWQQLQRERLRYWQQEQPILVIFDQEGNQSIFPYDPGLYGSSGIDYQLESWLRSQVQNLEHGFFAAAGLFISNCAPCHHRNMQDDLTGPALAGVRERWRAYPEADLYRFIRNSQAMIHDGHPQAVAVWNEWKPVVMNNFNDLSDDEIEDLLDYVDWVTER